MRNRLPTALAVTALVVALMGWTGAANAVGVAFAQNAAKLAGFKASKTAKKNTVVVRGVNGKIDAASIPAQARGAQGAQGPVGPPGAQGAQGIQGIPGPPGGPNPNADTLNGYAANGLVRTAQGTGTGTVLTGADVTQATLSITAPHAGFVFITTDYNLVGTGCPCDGWFLIRDNVNGALVTNYRIVQKATDGGFASGGIGWVFPVAAGVRTFDLRAHKNVGATVSVDAPKLRAIYVPFGSTGGGTLGMAGAASGSPSATR